MTRKRAPKIYACRPDPNPSLSLSNATLRQQEPMEILPADVEYDKALDRALRLLARRPYSRWEVRTRLERMGVAAEVADKVDARLVELGVLDDPAFAEVWVDHARGRGVGARAIRENLKAKGVPAETIDEATSGLSREVEMMRALELAQRRIRTYAGLTQRKAFGRLSRFLLSKGYDEELVLEVCRMAVGGPREAETL